jgi:RHS repeat-associated protein
LNPGIQAPGGQYITSLSYNQDGRLATVNSSGGALGSYTYDGFGQRLIKTVSTSYGEIYQYGQEGALLEETNSSGVAQADYIYLNGRPVAVLNGSTLYYLHDDMLGTPQLATDRNQNIQWQASYDAFGQASVSGTVTQNLRFPGQYFDVESGWNHNGFRDYLPAIGRYAEPDPLGRLGSGNDLYAYVYDNPTNLIDPLGLCPLNKINCNTVLPNGQTVGQFVRKYRTELQNLVNQALQNPEDPDPNLPELLTGAFLAIAEPDGPIDFKKIFSGQANAAFLGEAGNFAYYATGSGILPTWELDAGASLYGVLSTIPYPGHPGKPFSTLGNGPMLIDDSAAAVRDEALASNGCPQ